MEDNQRKSTSNDRSSRGKGVALGAGAGIVFGAAFGNPGAGMVFGAALGLVFGPALVRKLG